MTACSEEAGRDGARAGARQRRDPGIPRRGERGVALLLSLLTMVLLAVVVIEFTTSSQVAFRRASMWVASRRAGLLAEAGVTLAGEVLRQDFALGNTDTLLDFWARELPPIDTGAGMLAVRIEDEHGKLNLNTLATGALSPAGRRFQSLLDALGLDRNLASAVADWVDRNREPGTGALAPEHSFYASKTPPYRPRNGPMRSWAELALVRGFTPAVIAKLRPHATVLPDVDLRVNVNTATPEVLAAMDPQIGPSLARRIVDARATAALASAAALRSATGLSELSDSEIDTLFRYSSRWFRVRASGDVGSAIRSVEALVLRDEGVPRIVHLLPRRGPNIVGLDSGIRARIDDGAWLGAARR